MTIIQWNIRGYRANYGELINLLRTYTPQCVCLQETLLGDRVPRPPQRYYLRCCSPSADPTPGTGLAILVHRSQSCIDVPLRTPLQALACRVGTGRMVTICNIYISPNEVIRNHDLEQLIQQLPPPYLLLGDFNAKHPLWGGLTDNLSGRSVDQFITNNDVVLMNSGANTHYHVQTNSHSAIDLSLCSPGIAADYQWKVMDDLSGSDHYPILIDDILRQPAARQPQYLMKHAKWAPFRNGTAVDELHQYEDSADMLNTLMDTITSAADENIPKSSGLRQKVRVPWWTDECSRVDTERKRAMRRYQRSGLVVDKISYNRWRARARYTKQQAKKQSWQAYVSTLNADTPMTKIWQRIRKMTGKYSQHPAPCLTDGQDVTSDPVRVALLLSQHFQSVSASDGYSPAFATVKGRAESMRLDFTARIQYSYNDPVTETEMIGALRQCRNTAAGDDNIRYEMLRHLHTSSLKLLLQIYNQYWLNDDYPDEWRRAVILAFPKPNKPPTSPSSYRPIALTSCVGKLMEKIVNTRLMSHLEANDCLSPHQYGFRKMRAAPDALIRLSTDIMQALSRREHLVCVFFDMKKAYDTTWRYGILKRLHEIGIRGHMAFYIKNFLSDRKFQTRVGAISSEWHTQEEGVPQGSVLSCCLFALAIDGITTCLPHGVKCSLYVDDFMIYTTAARLQSAERRLQQAINNVAAWTLNHGFTISVEKTEIVNFNRSRSYAEPNLTLNGRMLKVSESARFLGMIFDEKLTWKPHIRNLKMECTKRLSVLRCIAHRDWGADRLTMLRLYRSLIRSKLDYGCVIYASAKDSVLDTLNPVHNQALRICTGAFRSSPVVSLHAETGEPPLNNRRMQLLAQYYTHIDLLPDSPTYQCVHQDYDDNSVSGTFAHRYRDVVEVLGLEISVMPVPHRGLPIWNIDPGTFCHEQKIEVKSNYSANNMRALFLSHKDRCHGQSVHLFTDGSKNGDSVGCAAVCDDVVITRRLNKHSSIFTAELTAIADALLIINDQAADQFTVFSDSKSALEAIQHYNSSHPIVNDILSWLIRLAARRKNIRFCWVPAHVGVTGNELADSAARRVSTSNSEIYNASLPHRDYYAAIRKSCRQHWAASWTDTNEANKLRSIKDSVTPWRSSYQANRRIEIMLARLRIGHTRLTHKYLMERGEPPQCETCQTQLTVRHILAECPTFAAQRLRHFPSSRNQQPSEIMKIMLAEGDEVYTPRAIIDYINECNIAEI